MIRLSSYIILLFLALSCKSKSQEPTTVYPYLPPISQADLQAIAVESPSGDLIYNDYGISMGFPDPTAVRNSLSYIKAGEIVQANSCAPSARIFYNDSQGSLMREMDLYIAGGCLHMVYLENGQPQSASPINDTGAEFYTRIVQQFLEQNGGQ